MPQKRMQRVSLRITEDKIEKERKQAVEMRNQAMERIGGTKTRKVEDEES